MKEYLTKNSNGDYQLVNHRFSDDDIEVPHGAERFTEGGFFKDKLTWFNRSLKEWTHKDNGWCGYNEVLWQREPKYKEFLNENDNYNLVMLPEHAGDDERSGLIEVPDGAIALVTYDSNSAGYWFNEKNKYKGFGRTSNNGDFGYRDINAEDDFKKYAERVRGSKILWQRYTQPESLPFVDDEPKGIDATLAERQASYGNFEDVAFVTENIMSVLGRVRVNGLSELPNTHRMALYMIASKMARIVNGDFNHLDSWHDIGGYAKLIENLIKGE